MSIGLAALMLNVTPYRYHDYYWTPPEKYHYNGINKCRWSRYFDFHKIPLSDVPIIHAVFSNTTLKCSRVCEKREHMKNVTYTINAIQDMELIASTTTNRVFCVL